MSPTMTGRYLLEVRSDGTTYVEETSYLFSESFDSAGYDKSWTQSGAGSDDPDYTTSPAPLEGTQSLRVIGVRNVMTNDFTATDPIYGYMIARVVSNNGANYTFRFRNSSLALLAYVYANTDNNWWVKVEGGSAANTSISCVGVTHHIWFEYSAAAGTADVYVSTTATKPGSPTASVSGGTGTGPAANLYVQQTIASDEVIIDKVRLSDSSIGSDPS